MIDIFFFFRHSHFLFRLPMPGFLSSFFYHFFTLSSSLRICHRQVRIFLFAIAILLESCRDRMSHAFLLHREYHYCHWWWHFFSFIFLWLLNIIRHASREYHHFDVFIIFSISSPFFPFISFTRASISSENNVTRLHHFLHEMRLERHCDTTSSLLMSSSPFLIFFADFISIRCLRFVFFLSFHLINTLRQLYVIYYYFRHFTRIRFLFIVISLFDYIFHFHFISHDIIVLWMNITFHADADYRHTFFFFISDDCRRCHDIIMPDSFSFFEYITYHFSLLDILILLPLLPFFADIFIIIDTFQLLYHFFMPTFAFHNSFFFFLFRIDIIRISLLFAI